MKGIGIALVNISIHFSEEHGKEDTMESAPALPGFVPIDQAIKTADTEKSQTHKVPETVNTPSPNNESKEVEEACQQNRRDSHETVLSQEAESSVSVASSSHTTPLQPNELQSSLGLFSPVSKHRLDLEPVLQIKKKSVLKALSGGKVI